MLDDVEHLRNALVDLADEPALGRNAVLTEGDLTRGRDLQAHLVLDVGDEDAVALTELAGLVVEVELRNEEQREALGAGARALGASEYQVEEVLGHVLIARGDEALHTVDVPGAVFLLRCLGAACADIRSGVGLGQHHGGAPAALGADLRPLLLLVGAVVVEDLRESCARGVHEQRGVGAEDHLAERPVQRTRSGHAAEVLVQTDLVPAGLDVGVVRLLERLGDRDAVRLGVEGRGIAVALGERIGDDALCQVLHLAEHVDSGLVVEIAELSGLEDLVEFEHVEEVELQVAHIALVMTHCWFLLLDLAYKPRADDRRECRGERRESA
ncbi:Uncharacterised protein [Mycobacteroides abscessus subsp. abscessus]|nr:Uncharacterised protein [Mycobacteroides abscessus subsp. abscessus]